MTTTQGFCLRITAYHNVSMARNQSFTKRTHAHIFAGPAASYIQNALRLCGPWCGVAVISVQLLRHGLVRRGNSLVVTVNPADLVCSGSGPMLRGFDMRSQTSRKGIHWISLFFFFERKLASLRDSCISKCSTEYWLQLVKRFFFPVWDIWVFPRKRGVEHRNPVLVECATG